MTGADDIQGELQCAGGVATGWCWSPSRPRERLRVALLVDGNHHGTTTATRLRLDLVRDGVRDGYHGFSLPLPDPLASDAMLEAQELGTGRVFARMLGSLPPHIRGWDQRLAGLDRHLRTLRTGLPLAQLRDRTVADILARAARALRRERREDGWVLGTTLRADPEQPAAPRPSVSLLLDAVPDGAGALAAIKAIKPMLHQVKAELLVADNGAGIVSASLAAQCGPGLMRRREASGAGRLNALLGAAHGDCVCILWPAPPWAPSLARLLRRAASMPHAVLVSPAAARAAGPHTLPILPDPLPHAGARIVASRAAFATEGFDPEADDGAGLMELEFGLRARAAGFELHAWSGPAFESQG